MVKDRDLKGVVEYAEKYLSTAYQAVPDQSGSAVASYYQTRAIIELLGGILLEVRDLRRELREARNG